MHFTTGKRQYRRKANTNNDNNSVLASPFTPNKRKHKRNRQNNTGNTQEIFVNYQYKSPKTYKKRKLTTVSESGHDSDKSESAHDSDNESNSNEQMDCNTIDNEYPYAQEEYKYPQTHDPFMNPQYIEEYESPSPLPNEYKVNTNNLLGITRDTTEIIVPISVNCFPTICEIIRTHFNEYYLLPPDIFDINDYVLYYSAIREKSPIYIREDVPQTNVYIVRGFDCDKQQLNNSFWHVTFDDVEEIWHCDCPTFKNHRLCSQILHCKLSEMGQDFHLPNITSKFEPDQLLDSAGKVRLLSNTLTGSRHSVYSVSSENQGLGIVYLNNSNIISCVTNSHGQKGCEHWTRLRSALGVDREEYQKIRDARMMNRAKTEFKIDPSHSYRPVPRCKYMRTEDYVVTGYDDYTYNASIWMDNPTLKFRLIIIQSICCICLTCL